MLFGTNIGFSGTPSSLLPNEIGGVDAHVLTTATANAVLTLSADLIFRDYKVRP